MNDRDWNKKIRRAERDVRDWKRGIRVFWWAFWAALVVIALTVIPVVLVDIAFLALTVFLGIVFVSSLCIVGAAVADDYQSLRNAEDALEDLREAHMYAMMDV